MLKSTTFDTPIGSMIAIADKQNLYLLEFFDRKGLEEEIKNLKAYFGVTIKSGVTEPVKQIKWEIEQYFNGNLQIFSTPFQLIGTAFKQQAWQALVTVPYGATISYADQATLIKRPAAVRAVAHANATNQLAIIVPCHRIIRSNGGLSGYGAGTWRKEWLIHHEKKNK